MFSRRCWGKFENVVRASATGLFPRLTTDIAFLFRLNNHFDQRRSFTSAHISNATELG
jgi:hypothetical protein